jgi:hypothetical protein
VSQVLPDSPILLPRQQTDGFFHGEIQMDVVEDIGGVQPKVPFSVGKIPGEGGNDGIGADTGQGLQEVYGKVPVKLVGISLVLAIFADLFEPLPTRCFIP